MKKKLSWKNRDNDLSEIKRYHKFKVMFYRTNLYIHYNRVKALLDMVTPIALKYYPDFDVRKSELISKFHDDYELVLKGGDISLQLKLSMGRRELSELEEKEICAAEVISKIYCNPLFLNEYRYKNILFHSVLKDCREAQLHSFVDKLDGYCEAIHENLAGNTIFLEPIINYHIKTFNDLKKNFPLIKKLFGKKGTLLDFPVVDLLGFFEEGMIGGSPHTIASIEKKTLIPHYEAWKRATLNTFPNGMELLTKQVEFHRKI